MNTLLAAAKKASTRKWLSQEGLTLNGWMDFTFTEWKNNSIQKLSEHLTSCRELSAVSFSKKAKSIEEGQDETKITENGLSHRIS